MTKLPLRPNVCMLVCNKEGRLFLGERYAEPGRWQFPQGGVEKGLSLEENVLRELNEELGAPVDRFKILRRLSSLNEYEFESPPDYAVGKWRGQSQTFWVVLFTGLDEEIKLDLHQPEFASWRWCATDEVRLVAEKKRLAGYLKPLQEFEDMLKSGLILP